MENNCLKIYPANDGDSFLLNFDGLNFLIDGGYVNTYRNFIKKDLQELTKKREVLDYLIVTHIDQDHISGINKFLEENNKLEIVKINNVWHNSLKHLCPIRSDKKLNSRLIIEGLAEQGYLKEIILGQKNVSAIQGSTLASLINQGNYKWNEVFNHKAISIENKQEVNISKNVKLILLSPNNEKIDRLYKFWQRELLKNGFLEEVSEDRIFDDAFEKMVSKEKQKKQKNKFDISIRHIKIKEFLSVAFQEDDSATNGSSLAFILESKDKRVLFLGDSHPSLICKSLKSLYKPDKFPIKFDFIKVSHHGSFSNNSPELFSLIQSDKFIISTNGKKNLHPNKETIAQIIAKNNQPNIYYNYSNESSKFFSNPNFQKEYKFQIIENLKETPLNIKF